MLLHPAAPGRVYQQNHEGTYRSDDHGESWRRIDGGLPTDFGFGLALDPADAETCFVVPMDPMEGTFRATPGALRVYRFGGGAREAGRHRWTALDRGLPTTGAYLSVLREGMASDGLDRSGLYVGTGGGHLFHSPDGGRRWKAIAAFLPPILSVTATVV